MRHAISFAVDHVIGQEMSPGINRVRYLCCAALYTNHQEETKTDDILLHVDKKSKRLTKRSTCSLDKLWIVDGSVQKVCRTSRAYYSLSKHTGTF